METEQFVCLVRDLRAAQRKYFRTRHPAMLDECRKLERAVDDAVSEILDPRLDFDLRTEDGASIAK